jgi:methylase of polypeptide subunit release factors
MSATPSVPSSPLALDDSRPIEELGAALRAAGLTGEGVRSVLGSAGELLSRSVDIPLHERRLEGVEPLGTLVKLLVLDAPARVDEAHRAFAPLTLERLEELGILEVGGGLVRASIRIVPHDEILIASDRRLHTGETTRPDHVAGVHGPSLTLSHLTVRRQVASALDVGTGSGIQAILAARHSERVVATDVNPRALNFAAFNARLNGVESIEFRCGSFFEPVEGSRFGLVSCNPPFVISPETAYLFRDSGLAGDTVSRDVVRRAPAALEEGAFAQMLVSWIVSPGEDWSSPLREWVDGSGCDAWLLHYGTDDPLTHAGNWLRHEIGHDPAAYAVALDNWTGYFERLGIEGIAAGAVILRRRAGANWVRTDRLSGDRLRPASDHILRVFAAGDLLAGLTDERGLLGERFSRARGSRLEQRVAFDDGQWAADRIELRLEDGLGFTATLDPATAALVAELDGTRTLGEAVDDLARLEGTPRAAVEQDAVTVVAGLLAAGFLERASG